MAPAPSTDHCTDGTARPPPLAENRTTSPVRACDSRGSIVSAGTVLAATVTTVVDVPFSLVARTVARPAATALTTPAASTVATEGDSDVQATSTPSRGMPSLVNVRASSRAAAPGTSGAASGAMTTELTSCGLMRIVAQPVLPLTMAPTFSSPGAKTVTRPSSSAAPTSKGAPNQAVGLASITAPLASYAVAVKRMV